MPHQCVPGLNSSTLAVKSGNNKIKYQDILPGLANATNDLSMPCHEQRTGVIKNCRFLHGEHFPFSATAYGDGVYFATSFSYSASSSYSPPDKKAQKYIFQCRVLTGHFTQGQSGLKEPPMRTHELRYDSVVDNTANPKMYVVFKDMQVYPEYVITLKA